MLTAHANAAAPTVLLYCRPGFEAECAQEIGERAAALGIVGYARTDKDAAYVRYVVTEPAQLQTLIAKIDWRSLIFARQRLRVLADCPGLPNRDRVAPLLAALETQGGPWSEVWVEPPDSDSGKELATFCRKFSAALVTGLKRAKRLSADNEAPRLHGFFPASDHCLLAEGGRYDSAPWPQGIIRLKFPHEAPSRSTLKLEEALLTLLSAAEQRDLLKPGMNAVDLGAAPGGWTWQLVRRGMRVAAVDNGPMAPTLMDSGLVKHWRQDGFRFRPQKPVDWLVCDMVEQPRRVAELIGSWFAEGLCRQSVFNLKLPMKKRYAEVQLCFETLRSAAGACGPKLELRAKQLYHDREEITVFARRR